MSVLASRDNPKVKRWAKLARDARYRRAEKRALIEGPHLLAAALQHGHQPLAVLATEEGAADPEIGALIARSGLKPVILAKGVFRAVVDAETPRGLAAEIAIPRNEGKDASQAVFLEGVQDPSNVGAIIRSAAAFGIRRVVLDPACADPWSPKALRAGMGGHFGLQIAETKDLVAEVGAFKGMVVCTVPRGGTALADAPLQGALAWIFGGEGRGLSAKALQQAKLRVSIPTTPATESLNVAAAAAICLYENFSRSAAGS